MGFSDFPKQNQVILCLCLAEITDPTAPAGGSKGIDGNFETSSGEHHTMKLIQAINEFGDNPQDRPFVELLRY